eukprot:2056424-Karenia_brevis.AAC.1
MPALFALAQHDALQAAAGRLATGEKIFSFLDDLYVVTTRDRAHVAFEEVASQVERHAGVRTHTGKLKAWCRGGGPTPPGLVAVEAQARAANAAEGREAQPVWTANLSEDRN